MNKYINNIKYKKPVIHNITNLVTINDVANIELACGAHPIMAMAPQEMEEVVKISDGLNLNIGTPSAERFEAMRIAAHAASKKQIPIVLDLVGVGVSEFRMNFVKNLLSEVHIDIIKGNYSEIKAFVSNADCAAGVDVSADVEKASEKEKMLLVKETAKNFECIAIMTGETDYIASCAKSTETDGIEEHTINVERIKDYASSSSSVNGKYETIKCECVSGGSPMMAKVTGMGCRLSGLICAFVAAAKIANLNKNSTISPVKNLNASEKNNNYETKNSKDDLDEIFNAAKAALLCMKKAGERAQSQIAATDYAHCGNEIYNSETYGNETCEKPIYGNATYSNVAYEKPICGNATYGNLVIDEIYKICNVSGVYEDN